MMCFILWMKGYKILREDIFEDILEAKSFVLNNLDSFGSEQGITSVEVFERGQNASRCSQIQRIR